MKLYHATSSRYNEGEELVSLLTQVERGWLSEEEAETLIARWEAGDGYLGEDGAMVSLTADLDEARYVRDEFNVGEGIILEIDGDALQQDGLLRRNAEGYPAVLRSIPAAYITGTTD